MAEYGKQLQEIIRKKMTGIIPEMVEKSATVHNKTLAVINGIRNIIEEEKQKKSLLTEKKSNYGKTATNLRRTIRAYAQRIKSIGKKEDSVNSIINSKSRIEKGSQALRLLLTISYAEKGNAQANISEDILRGKNGNRIKQLWNNTQ